MSGVTALVQLRTSSGARLPQDAVELVASFVPRSFSSLTRPRQGEVVSPSELREKIYRYIMDGETVGGPEAFPGRGIWFCSGFDVMVEHGIELLFLIGLEGYATLQSIFNPPAWGHAYARAGILRLGIACTLGGFHARWVLEHGPSPAASTFHGDVDAWWVVAGLREP
jgi:hypothetical protein